MTSQADWAFVSGLVNARSERLLGARAALALLQADSAEERATRVRASQLFADAAPSARPVDEVEARFATAVRLIASLGPDARIGDLFLAAETWPRFRARLKAQFGAQMESAPAPHDAVGDALDEVFHLALADGSEREDVRPFAAAAAAVRAALAAEKPDVPGTVDRVLDAHETAALRSAAESLGGESLAVWVRLWTGLTAALAIVRARRLQWNGADALAAWRGAGFDEPQLATLALGREEEWPSAVESLGLPEAAAVLAESDLAVALARRIEARVMELARDARGMPAGPEVVFAFLWALRQEAVNLKLVLAAAEAGMPEDRVAAEVRG